MKLKKLIRKYKLFKNISHDDYCIDWKAKFEVDEYYYLFAILPTIIWQPYMLRRPNTAVLDIWWLNMHIIIGTWMCKED